MAGKNKAQRALNKQRLNELEHTPALLEAIVNHKSFEIYSNQLHANLRKRNFGMYVEKHYYDGDLLFSTLNQLKGLDMPIDEMIELFRADDKDMGWKIYWGMKRFFYDYVNNKNNFTSEWDPVFDDTPDEGAEGMNVKLIDEAVDLIENIMNQGKGRDELIETLKHGSTMSNLAFTQKLTQLRKNDKFTTMINQRKTKSLVEQFELINSIIELVEDEDSDLRKVSTIMKQAPDYFEELIYKSRAKYVITLFNNFAGADARGSIGLLDQYKLINTLYIERERLVKVLGFNPNVTAYVEPPMTLNEAIKSYVKHGYTNNTGSKLSKLKTREEREQLLSDVDLLSDEEFKNRYGLVRKGLNKAIKFVMNK
ncbi:hypothetical protein [Periweissella fabalis]|uniref:Uncharacterized protein n=1 Tax=Periweissella fabalis TaxID=1070421 RepID=A0A7X6N5B5_9LACO|nr:hypothetical protein [Periweissella fabalis]MCM0598310.1 hypothetical protein [Periweissella fabalis]NKZ24942.1 hypothetical protein [Periweissella fabalis]